MKIRSMIDFRSSRPSRPARPGASRAHVRHSYYDCCRHRVAGGQFERPALAKSISRWACSTSPNSSSAHAHLDVWLISERLAGRKWRAGIKIQ